MQVLEFMEILRNKYRFHVLVTPLLACLSGCGPEPPLTHHGVWEVTRVAADDGEAAAGKLDALVGKRAVYTRHMVHFESMQCLRPQYTREPMPADGGSLAVAGLEQGEALRERIAISCQGELLPPEQGGILYLRDRDTLLMTWQGGVLHLQRRSQGPSASY